MMLTMALALAFSVAVTLACMLTFVGFLYGLFYLPLNTGGSHATTTSLSSFEVVLS